MNKFRIETSGRGRVWLNDEEITGLKSISFRVAVNSVTEVTLTMSAASVEASGDDIMVVKQPRDEIEVTNLQDTERRFAKAGA